MSKKELNKVPHDHLMKVVEESGLATKVQSAYVKCTANEGDNHAKIYVARSKNVTRVDLSGFTAEHDGITQISRQDAKDLKLGSVMAQLDFTQSEEVVLEALRVACEALKEMPKPESKPKRKPKTKAKAKSEPADDVPARELSEEDRQKAERRAAIKAAAQRKAAAAG